MRALLNREHWKTWTLAIAAAAIVLVWLPSQSQAACVGDSPNGVPEGGEQCDDGNTNNNDSCTNACNNASCGDGILRTGLEACDDGGNANGDGCSSGCAVEAGYQCSGAPSNCTTVCGDGLVKGAEACDDGADNGTGEGFCLSNCSDVQICGDGTKNGTEECDDNNLINTDACTAVCKNAVCGDGIDRAGPSELCDDGALNGTGPGKCNSLCSRVQTCGDSFTDGTEQCDTGGFNTAACDWDCTFPSCGDNLVNGAAGGETCDDGNHDNANGTTDTCDSDCTYGCGNGIVSYRPGPVEEQCDDGNTTNGDGCDSNCKVEECGDGIVDAGEACDMGDLNGTGEGKCLSDCSGIQQCGDNFVQGTEQCEVGPGLPNTAGCDYDCTLAECGDGLLNTVAGEQCDDGNLSNNDGCDDNCTNASCGNGVIDHWVGASEECDDGNSTVGDGCSNCKIEDCGDGVVQLTEVCDNGALNGTGEGRCLTSCDGWQICGDGKINGSEECETPGGDTASCDDDCTLPVCGDVHTNTSAGEECDQDNATEGDGCDTNCQVSGCGNGLRAPGEQCDDGNNNSGDGCSSTCNSEECGDGNLDYGEFCDDGPYNGLGNNYCLSDCTAKQTCGNLLVEGTEECDDGNATNNDGCDNNCTFTACGNGVVTIGEDCDDGNTDPANGSSDLCDSNCTWPGCGNKVVSITANLGPASPEEACDDGNTVSGDGCTNDCLHAEMCGDNTTQAALGETCDDGNEISGDGCDSACKHEDCGDGKVTNNEECDDGNANNNDGCIITAGGGGSDPFGPLNCAIARCGDGFTRAGVESCDDGNLIDDDACTNNCCARGSGYEDGVLTARCAQDALEDACDYSGCSRADYIARQIDRADDRLERMERKIDDARLNGAARQARNLARRLSRIEVRLSRYCGNEPAVEDCLRPQLDTLEDVLADLNIDLLSVNP